MTDDQVVAFLGPQRLVRWPWDVLAPTLLPLRTKHYLAEVGLPRDVDWSMRFEATTDNVARLPDSPNYCIVGYDYEAAICMDERRNGSVVWIAPSGAQRFINGNIVMFGQCLLLYEQCRLARRGLDETEAQAVVAKTEQAIRACDSCAFDDPESFWSTIVEQMKLGQL